MNRPVIIETGLQKPPPVVVLLGNQPKPAAVTLSGELVHDAQPASEPVVRVKRPYNRKPRLDDGVQEETA